MSSSVLKSLVIVIAMFAVLPAQAATHHHTSTSYYSPSSPSSTGDDNLLGMQFGPEVASLNATAPEGQTVSDSDSRTRPMMGAYYEHRFLPYLAIRPELDYVQRGYSLSQGQGAQQVTTEFASNYLEIPVMAKGQYPLGRFLPYVVSGPFLGLSVGKGETTTIPGQQDQETSISNDINTWEFGWNFGAGSSYMLTNTLSLEASFRYSLGLSNVFSQAVPGQSIKLNSLQFLGGLAFAI